MRKVDSHDNIYIKQGMSTKKVIDMAKLDVSINEFRNSYKKHYELYKHGNRMVAVKSRRLLLFYSVECGLKCMPLQKIGKASYSDLQIYCKNKNGTFDGHNIKEMVKELGLDREYIIKRIQLKNAGGTVESRQFNELWRYGVESADELEEEKVEDTLVELAEYIGKRV